MRSHRTVRLVGLLALTGVVWPANASAHGIAQRADLPIPEWLFAWGAALVLVASFVALTVLWTRPRLQNVQRRAGLVVPLALDVLGGLFGVAVFILLVYAGFAGNQTATANVTPTFVFVIFWVGVPVVSFLFGDLFSFVNPWRAVGRAIGWVGGKVTKLPEPLAYPEWLGRWPAAAGILAFTWVELVYVHRDDPSTLAILALIYAAAMLAAMSLFGVESWTRNGDPFAVLFNLYSRISPLDWSERRVSLRWPLGGLPGVATPAGSVALVCVMIGTTSFDGFSQGAIWTDTNGLAQRLTDMFGNLGLGRELAIQAAFTVGLLLLIAFITCLYWIGVLGMRSVARDHSPDDLARLFMHTLVPISLAYVIAHYFSLLAFQGQALGYFASDPLGTGADLLGTAGWSIDYNVVSASGIWYVQVAALITGHVAALLLAHDRALALWPDPRTATRSQYWMLLVMVTFTSLGLWILSATAQ